jgi:Fe-S cluster biogenesis protein NfuA
VWKRRSWALFVHLSRIYRGASPRRLTCTDFPVNDLGVAVPEITGVRIVGPGAEPPPAGCGEELADRVRRVLDAEVNPVIAAHGGRVALVELDQGWAHIRLEGGCQGCSLAEVTIRQGIEPLLRARVPELVGLADVTDHAAGTDPYFSAEKR